ncbi:MAG: competence/damage-inducible protein A [Deltaproteobacteria bacterium]|nr:competence/damage-inducible protein A [Deltaproteobacteria bacterium]
MHRREFEIVATGEELLLGMTADSNSTFIAQRAASVGWSLARITVVGDTQDRIADALREALARRKIVVVTGGLGPTEDDRTRYAAAQVFERPIVTSNPSLERLREFWTRRGRPMPESNVRQAQFPEGAQVWPNPVGTADGFRCSDPDRGEAVFVPGVPREAKELCERYILPWLAGMADGTHVAQHQVRLFGLAESEIAETLGDWPRPDSGVMLIYGPEFPEIKLTLAASAESADVAQARVAEARDQLRAKLGPHIFSEDGRDLPATVAHWLTQSRRTLALAESCTGGLIAKLLTDVPGSSAFLREGCVTYSNEAKIARLGVRPETIATHGAVSAQCAMEMAEGALRTSGADLALAVTGIAGPDGGTADKPVGTVHVALAETGRDTQHAHQVFRAGRDWVRRLTAHYALNMLRRRVVELL